MKIFKKISEEQFNFEIANRDCIVRYYDRKENGWEMNRYEFTITYDPKRVYSIEYAYTLTQYVVDDIEKFCNRIKQTETNHIGYCYVVETQKNGYPHIHGTILTEVHIKPDQQVNFERLLYRKYGKSDMWATGPIDKFHPKSGLVWSEYLKKEGEVKYYFYKQDN